MAAAPLIGIAFSAAGQVAGMVTAGNDRANARAQSEAQIRHSRRVHALEVERFDYARNAAERQYVQEAIVIQEQSRQAREALEQARIQQEINVMQQDTALNQQNAQFSSQIRQMLTSAAAVQTEAAGANAADLYQLIGRFAEGRGGRQALEQRLTQAMNQSNLQTNALNAAEITDYQNVLDQVGTRTRAADIQSASAERQAQTLEVYRQLVDKYTRNVNSLQNRMTDFTLNAQPTLLSLQEQRNNAALSSARFANQAESAMGRTSSLLNLQNNIATANAQSGGSGSGFVNVLNTLGSVVPQVAANWSTVFGSRQQQQPQFGTTPGFDTGYGTNVRQTGSYSFYGDSAFPARAVPMHRSRNPYSGVPDPTRRGFA